MTSRHDDPNPGVQPENESREKLLECIRTNRKKFDIYNAKKLSMLYEAIGSQEIIELIEAIPLLLSNNGPELPGHYPSDNMPLGISGYSPTEDALSFVRRQFPSAHVATRPAGKPFGHMFAMMGSGGTIAYTRESDFDFWVCYLGSEFDEEQVAAYKAKCRSLEEWILENFNVETHFYLNDIDKVRKNIFDEDEEGYFGAANGELLKEEFLRSSIILAGAVPLWWVIPAEGCDASYGRASEMLARNEIAGRYICLGNIGNIRQEDFLVGALFQILKSLDNPFKAIVKMGLLQRYLHGGSGTPFICGIIKSNIQNDRYEPEHIDAYLIMFNQVLDYYSFERKDQNGANILRVAFYLKVDPRLSEIPAGEGGVKAGIMRSIVSRWNWSAETIERMDAFQQWGIEPVNRILNSAKRFVLGNYRELLSYIEKGGLQLALTEEDIKGITRKIQSHFGVSEGTIDTAAGFKNYPPERALVIEYIRGKDGADYWILSRRIIQGGRLEKTIFHKQSTFFGMVAFICVNGLYQKDYTRLEMATGIHSVDPIFMRELIPALTLHFRHGRFGIRASYYLRDPFPMVSFLVINPYTKYLQKIDDIVFMYFNSWGETRYESRKGEGDIPQIVSRILTGLLQTRMNYENSVRIMSSEPFASTAEFRHLKSFMADVFAFFYVAHPGVRYRYVTVLGNRHTVFFTESGEGGMRIGCNVFESEVQMLYGISFNNGLENRLRVDPKVKSLGYLSSILENHRSGAVDIYFQQESKYAYFFVADERGALSFFRKKSLSFMDYLVRLRSFALSAMRQAVANNPDSPLAGRDDALMFHRLVREGNIVSIADPDPRLVEALAAGADGLVPFVLVLDREAGELRYRFSLPDGDMTDYFRRNEIAGIIDDLRSVMSAVSGYSYHVSAISLENAGARMLKEWTSFAFAEKNRFELIVERAMEGRA